MYRPRQQITGDFSQDSGKYFPCGQEGRRIPPMDIHQRIAESPAEVAEWLQESDTTVSALARAADVDHKTLRRWLDQGDGLGITTQTLVRIGSAVERLSRGGDDLL